VANRSVSRQRGRRSPPRLPAMRRDRVLRRLKFPSGPIVAPWARVGSYRMPVSKTSVTTCVSTARAFTAMRPFTARIDLPATIADVSRGNGCAWTVVTRYVPAGMSRMVRPRVSVAIAVRWPSAVMSANRPWKGRSQRRPAWHTGVDGLSRATICTRWRGRSALLTPPHPEATRMAAVHTARTPIHGVRLISVRRHTGAHGSSGSLRITAAEPFVATRYDGLTSDSVLAALAPALLPLGYRVELGKRVADRIRLPVLFGDGGRERVAYEVDAFQDDLGVVVEIEAGRGARGNAVYRDLIRAAAAGRSVPRTRSHEHVPA
jgi:hypothetical protein